ncbi:molybdenum cofactor guanylyltransferase [Halomonas sp. 18H]|uniref:molybdenum cofactor guanylyltransferase MobA n=1 Tax=Halomonas almeriensis TaxID=308163 RepID=UPI00222E2FBF|nr:MULTISPECIES: molybdenum cofactor guanylyltransferase MobA [Halomonas]MCW4151183.1 molybdenum cofactor guanylyltransferase [Halomonas sp. 18H]MDN3553063.1 molybdenum cofactor guanylyltransferase MobA [Halomonas almeriensis]
MIPRDELTGLVLAGGRGRRMGGCDKGLVAFDGRPLAGYAAGVLRDHVKELVIVANRHCAAYAELADRVVADVEPDYRGPLMGLYSGLQAARGAWLVMVPCDVPGLPSSLVARLVDQRGTADVVVAHDGTRPHPVVALVRVDLADDLAACLARGERKLDTWQARHRRVWADFSDCPAAFTNLNTRDERLDLERRRGKES